MNETLDINYYKLNPYLLDVLKKSIDELDKLINNYRFNNRNKINKDENLEYILISKLSNDIIIYHLLGRVLKIISNNNLLNNNTDVALDLAKSLLFYFYKIEYQEYIQKEDISYKVYSLSTFINSNYS